MSEPEVQSVKGSRWLRLVDQWSRWRGASVNRSILGAAVTIGALSVGVRVVAALKEIIVAKTFGTSDALDAFLVAFLLPFFAINVISGSFNVALIPTFVRVRDRDGHPAAQRLLASMLWCSLAILIGVTALLGLSASSVLPLIASSFSPAKIELSRRLFYLLLPTLLICGLSTTWSAVLNAGQKFAWAAITPILTPLVTIVVLLVVGPGWGIYPVVFAALIGFSAEALMLGLGMKRLRFSLLPRWHGFDQPVKEVLGQYAPVAAGAILMSGSLVVNQSMAAMLGTGNVAALNYGTKVVSFILGVGSLALGTAVLPYFSRMVAAQDWRGARHTLRTFVRLLMLASLPATAALVVGSESLTRVLFQRGHFTSEDTGLVAPIAACYALQIPFYLAGQVGVRLLIAMGKSRTVMMICAVNLIANVSANWMFMKAMGVTGIALATSLVYLLSCGQIGYALRREFKRRHHSDSPYA